MKKIFMTLAAVAVAATMNAQIYVGGGINLQTGKTTNEVTAGGVTTSIDNKNTTFGITPEIGYKLDEKMAVGLAFGFTTTTSEPGTGVPGTSVKNTRNNFNFVPYFRYTFVTWDKLSVFADAELGFSFGKNKNERTAGGVTTTAETKTNAFHFAVLPGISYQLNDKINFVAKLGNGIGYWHEKTENPAAPGTTNEDKTNTFGLNLNSLGLTFGAYYNF